ncbi:thiamine pyrophosphate-dependent dehydrogenase E1 component subunit alpha [Planktomarina temperata]|nr:thiamine pyrophosphate-dependent dehydrogenase E1 component subunit alpha [Planktomarina temperata]
MDTALSLIGLKKLVEIREIEECIRKEFFDKKIFSFLHLMIGQEASPVGISLALDANDIVMGNHRSHGHYLAKGGNLEKMVREIFGDVGGCCKGYGGSMHMLDRSVRFEGSTPILGSVSCLATGKAFAQKLDFEDNITVAYLGDGAAEEGVFYESVNLASVKRLPIVFVIEDNGYAVNSKHRDRKSNHYNFRKVFEGLGASYERIDGQSLKDVFHAMRSARAKALAGQPVVLHLDVVRMHGHSGPLLEKENQQYRETNDTIANRLGNDCITRHCSYMKSGLSVSEAEILEIISKKTDEVHNIFETLMGDINVKTI